MDKNTIIGFILIILVLFGFFFLNRPTQEQIEAQKRYQDSIANLMQSQTDEQQAALIRQQTENPAESDSLIQSRIAAKFGDFAGAMQGTEDLITLENDLMILKITTKGGKIRSAQLKNYTDYKGSPLLLFQDDDAQFSLTVETNNNRVFNTDELFFESVNTAPLETTLRLKAGDDAGIDFVYRLHPDDYMVDFSIVPHHMQDYLKPGTNSLYINWAQKMRQLEQGRKYEEQYTRLTYKYFVDDVEQMNSTKNDSKTITNKLKWIGYKDQFFSSALIASEGFTSGQLESQYLQDDIYLKQYTSTMSVDFDPKLEKSVDLNFYFGPNDYNLLKRYDKTKFAGQDLQLEKLVPLGWTFFRYINKWIIIPIFDWLNSWISSVGLAILFLTLIIKMGLFPLVYKSFMSSAKMRVMKPQIEAITSKYPGQENAMTRQQKTMELYRQVGINPMSGCLPMLLQMPFLLALFMFFPSAIELRHQSFLWAPDLSTYDAVIKWDTYVPLVTPYFGNHVSIFCLLMTIVNVIYTKFSMDQTGTGQEQMPGMKMMMYIMPVFMLIFLNSYPAGLNYYYFVSSLITILQTVLFRYFLNEEALLAKLEANKKNPPKKKSGGGFMARLEEAQRKQQAMLKEQQKQRNKGKR
ncbi:MAG: membrane protein insertase YidC [Candidatus Azobacteroides sp.]|nr:membrane protein insertase YidC [Candidatus Azobacteroides sp.]